VLHDYVSKRIVPLQERTRPAWLYTGVVVVLRKSIMLRSYI
jgi:hypothetical protein